MEIPTYLLFVLGCLGAADILLFHSVSHGIRSHSDSVKELITHSLRGPTYALLFLFIPNFELRGLWAWALLALLLFDVGISILDFSLEQDSRRFLGGLPSGEYVLHMLIAIVFGAFMATILGTVNHWSPAWTQLVYAPAKVPPALRAVLLVMSMLVLVSGVQDALAAARLQEMGRRMVRQLPRESASMPPCQTLIGGSSEPLRVLPVPKLKVMGTAPWMKCVLVAAGLYNLVWGAYVVLFPAALFRWTGITPINYPPIWQCVGMIVGVYGIGYLIAAQAPERHWPIVFVGLLGKVLGPIGMVWAVVQGELPVRMAWACLTNDLIWWAPFGLILLQGWTKQREAQLDPQPQINPPSCQLK